MKQIKDINIFFVGLQHTISLLVLSDILVCHYLLGSGRTQVTFYPISCSESPKETPLGSYNDNQLEKGS